MPRECISHHICDCHQEKMERLEARIEELEGAAKAMIDSTSYAGDAPPLEDTGERWLIAVEFEKWAAFTDALSDTREEE